MGWAFPILEIKSFDQIVSVTCIPLSVLQQTDISGSTLIFKRDFASIKLSHLAGDTFLYFEVLTEINEFEDWLPITARIYSRHHKIFSPGLRLPGKFVQLSLLRQARAHLR